MDQTLSIFLLALGTALATGLGALPFLWMRNPSPRWIGVANALAAGLMIGASVSLVLEGQHSSLPATLIGVGLGMAFILITRKVLPDHDELSIGGMKGLSARRALLLFLVMTIHSFAEGVGVGVAFGGGQAIGLMIAIAIAVHNIPEGLAISLTMVPRGTPVWKAALYSIASSLPQPLMAVPAYWFVEQFRPALPVGLGFAAGAMIWMVFSELLPESLKESHNARLTYGVTTLATFAMLAFTFML
ncbi:MAG TPA: ZIP family metal transporter [Anaerolineales bacterium]|nr:ZIP family metal transporter [Anaerolineales bacterium]HRF50089.1 ZIP family metal transporter [Anaerolineales bacterium]